ncbi:MAG: SDR family oxidoreductase [Thermodesulfobacteriota bacterium]
MTTGKEKKRVIIIGGSGMIGGALVHYFSKCCNNRLEVLSPNSKKLNLKDAFDIERYFRLWRPDCIINTAISSIDSDPTLAWQINYVGAVNLAKVALALDIPYIFISSAAALPAGNDIGDDEYLPLTAGLSNYSKSKLMCEQTLKHLQEREGLDYTIIRLAIVYGKHDYKIQGFHRLLFSIVDQALPLLFTAKGVKHSYTNARKVPLFVHHILETRGDHSGQIYNFVDEEPVELAQLILTIRNYIDVKRPRKIFFPYRPAKIGADCLRLLLKMLLKLGVEAKMPPELLFLEQCYRSQTLNIAKLQSSGFVDPWPHETIYSNLPDMLQYYIERWEHLNLISGFNKDKDFYPSSSEVKNFLHSPTELLEEIHTGKLSPFQDFEEI